MTPNNLMTGASWLTYASISISLLSVTAFAQDQHPEDYPKPGGFFDNDHNADPKDFFGNEEEKPSDTPGRDNPAATQPSLVGKQIPTNGSPPKRPYHKSTSIYKTEGEVEIPSSLPTKKTSTPTSEIEEQFDKINSELEFKAQHEKNSKIAQPDLEIGGSKLPSSGNFFEGEIDRGPSLEREQYQLRKKKEIEQQQIENAISPISETSSKSNRTPLFSTHEELDTKQSESFSTEQASLRVIISGEPVSHAISTLKELASLRRRTQVNIEDVTIISLSMAAGMPDIQKLAKQSTTKDEATKLLQARSPLQMSIAEAKLERVGIADGAAELRRLGIRTSPAWIIKYRGTEYVYEGAAQISRYLAPGGEFTDADGTNIATEGKIVHRATTRGVEFPKVNPGDPKIVGAADADLFIPIGAPALSESELTPLGLPALPNCTSPNTRTAQPTNKLLVNSLGEGVLFVSSDEIQSKTKFRVLIYQAQAGADFSNPKLIETAMLASQLELRCLPTLVVRSSNPGELEYREAP